jgi:hypothetical protein
MATYLYLSMSPESLVASMLPPKEFGAYLATGTRKQPHGQAIFFQVREGFRSDYFDLSQVEQRCKPHANGEPKHSVYLGIYRILEHVPLESLGSLWLFTMHGLGLELKAQQSTIPQTREYHLYQEICPVHPLIASSHSPDQYCKRITDTSQPISVPRICFLELQLAGLAQDPLHGSAAGLPYSNIDHIRFCLDDLRPGTGKDTKTVDRVWHQNFLYRCVKNGFFVGDQKGMLHYPFPSLAQLEDEYYAWWRCANDSELQYTGWGV